jgi:hypothetical protein
MATEPAYKLVKGKIEELERLLNDAVADGFSQVFREFPPFLPNVPVGNVETDVVYAFMMKRPDPMLPSGHDMANVIRSAAAALGLEDRLPPAKEGKVLDLVRPPAVDDAPTKIEPEYEHPTP